MRGDDAERNFEELGNMKIYLEKFQERYGEGQHYNYLSNI